MPLVPPSHPALWTKAEEFVELPAIHAAIRQLQEAHREVNAVALSAPQVGASIRLFVWRDGRVALNPSWEPISGSGRTSKLEGCCTWPGRFTYVSRFDRIRATWTDQRGAVMRAALEGIESRAFQHECDHLDGVCIFAP